MWERIHTQANLSLIHAEDEEIVWELCDQLPSSDDHEI
jgi:hypothetical protein